MASLGTNTAKAHIPTILLLGDHGSKRQKLGTILALCRNMWQFYPKTYQDTTITSTSPTRVKCIKVNYHIIIQLSLLVLSRVNDSPAALILCLLISVDSTSASPQPSSTVVLPGLTLLPCNDAGHFVIHCKLAVTPAHFSASKWSWIKLFQKLSQMTGHCFLFPGNTGASLLSPS